MDIPTFCREIETYLCRKNDGHLIRVTGPSFAVVSRWASQGIPLKVAFAGIDRYFERYYRQGPRRRPVKIDFCEADVLDAFDEWRRATGVGGFASGPAEARGRGPREGHVAERDVEHAGSSAAADGAGAAAQSDSISRDAHASGQPGDIEGAYGEAEDVRGGSARGAVGGRRGVSLPAHLERVLMRLTSARVSGTVDETFDGLIDRVSAELDAVRAAGGVRGDARRAVVDRLSSLDRELLDRVRVLLDDGARAALSREADEELAPFRATMTSDAFARSRDAAIDRLVRERFGLPTVAYAQS